MTRSLRILYIAIFLAILLVLGVWSLRSFSTFSTSAETTVQRQMDQGGGNSLRR